MEDAFSGTQPVRLLNLNHSEKVWGNDAYNVAQSEVLVKLSQALILQSEASLDKINRLLQNDHS